MMEYILLVAFIAGMVTSFIVAAEVQRRKERGKKKSVPRVLTDTEFNAWLAFLRDPPVPQVFGPLISFDSQNEIVGCNALGALGLSLGGKMVVPEGQRARPEHFTLFALCYSLHERVPIILLEDYQRQTFKEIADYLDDRRLTYVWSRFDDQV
jgi:hypothetical protein